MEQLVENLRKAFREGIDGLEWMGPETRKQVQAQRFFFGWAQQWRAKEREDSLRQQVLTNVHSPEMYRANGPLRNVPEFYATFEVKQGDKMFLPEGERAKIW
jgi:predicted metalloendopeptidase